MAPKPGHSLSSREVLIELCRAGVESLINQALDCEIDSYLSRLNPQRSGASLTGVVRNGYMPKRSIQSELGRLTIRQPRIDDRRIAADQSEQSFSSLFLQGYQRSIPGSKDKLLFHYLNGILESNFLALWQELAGLSGDFVALQTRIDAAHAQQRLRGNFARQFKSIWVDAIPLAEPVAVDTPSILVVMGEPTSVSKRPFRRFLAVQSGTYGSTGSWSTVIQDLQNRGIGFDCEYLIGDIKLGFWNALSCVDTRRNYKRAVFINS